MRTETERTVLQDGQPTAETVAVERTYDRLGRVLTETDPLGTTREVIYDPNGLVQEVRTRFSAPGAAAPSVRIDVLNAYDAMDRLTNVTNALGQTTAFAYDDRDRLTHTTTPLGRVTEIVYDGDGNPVAHIDPSGAVTETTYDPLNRAVRVVDARGREAETTYDREGRVLARRELGELVPGQARAERVAFHDAVYDEVGNLEEWQDGANAVTRQTFDELGRRKSLRVGVGTAEDSTTEFRYDRSGRLVEKIDGLNHATEVAYDLLGRVEAVTDGADRVREALEYDELGNAVKVTRGTGKVVERAYDPRGAVLEERDASVSPARTVRHRYDELGRLIWTRGPEPELATETFTYDDLDRVASRTDALGGMERFVYDDDGFLDQHVQRTSGATGAPLVVNYDYDARGILSELRDPEAGKFLFEADALGRPVRRVGPGGAQWRATYSALGDLERVESQIPGSAIQFTAYASPDGRGYPQALSTNEGATALQYTALGRLKKATYPDSSSEEYSYDLAGNRKTRRDAAAVGITYHYDAADQLTQISAGLVAGGAVLETFEHDDGGRRTRHTVGGAVTDYGYDGYGRLLKVTRTGYTADLTYTTLGRRAARSEGGATSRYPTSRFEQRGGSSYRLLRAGGFGSVVAEVQTPPTGPKVAYALQRDGSANVGHVFRTTGSSTTLEASPRRWSAFGTLRSGASALERGYASQAQEGATGLILMGARHYDPATGRFLQPDPLGIAASELYAYASNNPYMFWDPTGLSPISFSSASIGPIWDQPFDLGERVSNLALGSGGGIFRPEAEAIQSYVASRLDAATGGLLSTVSGGIDRVNEALLGPSCGGCYIGGAPPVAFPVGAGGFLATTGTVARVDELRAAIPLAQQGRVTMAVGLAEDAGGVQRVLIGTSEPRGYLRPGVTLSSGETVAPGLGHAEADIVNSARQNGLRLTEVGATRAICAECEALIRAAGAHPVTPLRRPQ